MSLKSLKVTDKILTIIAFKKNVIKGVLVHLKGENHETVVQNKSVVRRPR